MSDILCSYQSRQSARRLKHQSVVEHLYLDFRSFDAIVSVAFAIYHHFLNGKLGIVAVGDKLSVLSQERMLTHLCFQIFHSLYYLIQNSALERYIFHYVHFRTNLFLSSFISDESCSGTWKKTLWSLTEKQNASIAYLLSSVSFFHEVVVLIEIFQGRLTVANYFDIFVNGVHVNVINRSSVCAFVLIVSFSFVVHQLHALVETQFSAFVANTHKSFVCLVGVQITTGWNIHQQYSIVVALAVYACKVFVPNPYRRHTEIHRHTE